MFERQNLPAPEQPATIVDELVVDGLEHVHVNFRQLEFLQLCQALVSLVKINALAARNLVALGTARLLQLLVTEVVRLAYLGKIVHVLGTQLQFRIATREIVVERDMQRLVTRASRGRHVIAVIGPNGFHEQIGMSFESGKFRRKALLFEESGQHVRDVVEILLLYDSPVVALFDMAGRHRDDDAVRNKVAEANQAALDFGLRRERPIFLVIVVDIFKNIPIEFFFGADQRLDASLEGKCQEGILARHELVKFLDSLRLRSQEVVVLEKLDYLDQIIGMCEVDAVARFLRAVPEVVRILVQNFQHRISGE